MVSHQIGWILLQWKNKCDAPSSAFLQKGQSVSVSCTCLLCRFCLVGSLSLSSLHAKTAILLGIFNLHNCTKHSSWLPAAASSSNIWYALHVEYWPVESAVHSPSSDPCCWMTLPSTSLRKLTAKSISLSNSGLQPLLKNIALILPKSWELIIKKCSKDLGSVGCTQHSVNMMNK